MYMYIYTHKYIYIYIHHHVPRHSMRAAGRTLTMCSLRLHRKTKTLLISWILIITPQNKRKPPQWTKTKNETSYLLYLTIFTQKKAPAAAMKTKNNVKRVICACGRYTKQPWTWQVWYDKFHLPNSIRKKAPAANIKRDK